MSNLISFLAPDINAMMDYREALGYSRKSYESCLSGLDCFCADFYPEANVLTREIVISWLEWSRYNKSAPSIKWNNLITAHK